jgi:hypothetical protein
LARLAGGEEFGDPKGISTPGIIIEKRLPQRGKHVQPRRIVRAG